MTVGNFGLRQNRARSTIEDEQCIRRKRDAEYSVARCRKSGNVRIAADDRLFRELFPLERIPYKENTFTRERHTAAAGFDRGAAEKEIRFRRKADCRDPLICHNMTIIFDDGVGFWIVNAK